MQLIYAMEADFQKNIFYSFNKLISLNSQLTEQDIKIIKYGVIPERERINADDEHKNRFFF